MVRVSPSAAVAVTTTTAAKSTIVAERVRRLDRRRSARLAAIQRAAVDGAWEAAETAEAAATRGGRRVSVGGVPPKMLPPAAWPTMEGIVCFAAGASFHVEVEVTQCGH